MLLLVRLQKKYVPARKTLLRPNTNVESLIKKEQVFFYWNARIWENHEFASALALSLILSVNIIACYGEEVHIL